VSILHTKCLFLPFADENEIDKMRKEEKIVEGQRREDNRREGGLW
jgi:hypothetical protein